MESYSRKWIEKSAYPHKEGQDELEKMSKAELIAEIKRLQEIIKSLRLLIIQRNISTPLIVSYPETNQQGIEDAQRRLPIP